MKPLLALIVGLATFIIISSISLFAASQVYAADTTCTVSVSQTQVSPGDTFQVTVNFSDGKSYQFTYHYLGISDNDPVHNNNLIRNPKINPYSFTLPVPDKPFSGIKIRHLLDAQGRKISCTADITNISSSLPPPATACTYDFQPRATFGGNTIYVYVNNTLKDYKYTAFIGGIGGEHSETKESKSDGQPITLTVTAPDKKGTYEVNIRGLKQWNWPRHTCLGPTTLTVTENTPSGQNPCSIGPSGKCETAIGKIPTTIQGFAGHILTLAIGLAGGLALILMVIGSVRVLTSSGDQQKLAGGRDMIVAAVAGLLFLIFSVLILRFIGIEILKIPGFGG